MSVTGKNCENWSTFDVVMTKIAGLHFCTNERAEAQSLWWLQLHNCNELLNVGVDVGCWQKQKPFTLLIVFSRSSLVHCRPHDNRCRWQVVVWPVGSLLQIYCCVCQQKKVENPWNKTVCSACLKESSAQLVDNAQKLGNADERNTSATNVTPASNNTPKFFMTVTGSMTL